MNSAIQYSFMQQIFIECFLRARHYAKHWEYQKNKNKNKTKQTNKKTDMVPALFVLIVP